MKPQYSKDTTDFSSQAQKDALSSKSLEHPFAHLQINNDQSESASFNYEKLEDLIANLENDLSNGNWIIADYENRDLQMMPFLVKKANSKYPEMHLKFVLTTRDFTLSLKETITNGVRSSRYIINTQEGGVHFAVIDHRTIKNKISVILFESTTFIHNVSATRLGLRTRQAIEECQLPDCHFSVAEMDIQRSPSECGIFSLSLAKKLYTDASALQKIHEDNINGILCEPNTPVPSHKLDKYLPTSFYKHAQGVRRLEQYIKSNPAAKNEKTNKRGETLTERFYRHSIPSGNKALSISPHKKRISEYKAVFQL